MTKRDPTSCRAALNPCLDTCRAWERRHPACFIVLIEVSRQDAEPGSAGILPASCTNRGEQAGCLRSQALVPANSRAHPSDIVRQGLRLWKLGKGALELRIPVGKRRTSILLAKSCRGHLVADPALQPICIFVDARLVDLQLFVFSDKSLKCCDGFVADRIIPRRQAMPVIARPVDLEFRLSGDLAGHQTARKLKYRLDPRSLKLNLLGRELYQYVGLDASAAVNRSPRISALFLGPLNSILVASF